jgi:predicted Co/Zn/Cd cation transporter (cation efflux family)
MKHLTSTRSTNEGGRAVWFVIGVAVGMVLMWVCASAAYVQNGGLR